MATNSRIELVQRYQTSDLGYYRTIERAQEWQQQLNEKLLPKNRKAVIKVYRYQTSDLGYFVEFEKAQSWEQQLKQMREKKILQLTIH